ncbi:MAG TPA: hypothetical protein VF751_12365 [Chthoniobacterales bacterium]
MIRASEIEWIAPRLCVWRVYDPNVKAELWSTSITTDERTYLIDPTPLGPQALSKLRARSPVAGIVVTNENHQRSAADFARKFQAPIYSADSDAFPHTFAPIQIEGAPAGEIAVYCKDDSGTIIIGDALINFEPYGFALLPAKYCSNPKLMRRSLPKLLNYSFERMVFAHGTPILSGARHRLEQLLEED